MEQKAKTSIKKFPTAQVSYLCYGIVYAQKSTSK